MPLPLLPVLFWGTVAGGSLFAVNRARTEVEASTDLALKLALIGGVAYVGWLALKGK